MFTEVASRIARQAVVRDITYEAPSGPVEAYLVEPARGRRRFAVLFLHWLARDPSSNRTQFVDEAVALAGWGGVSVLPQGSFPWVVDPAEAGHDQDLLSLELARFAAGIDLLLETAAQPRLGIVGHDFGAMYAALLAVNDPRVAAVTLINGVPRWADWFLPFWPIRGDPFEYQRALAHLDPIAAVAQPRSAELSFQFARSDHFIAPMTAEEFARAAVPPSTIAFYPGDHALTSRAARTDRRRFLQRRLLTTKSAIGQR
jgi:pimeloyl-ACP methyl ester carboxylesterase